MMEAKVLQRDPQTRPGARTRATVLLGARAVADRVRGAPGTHVWLAVLAVTSGVIASVSPGVRAFLLLHNSTNLVQLRNHPVRVLIVSALWIQSPSAYLSYVALFELVHATAERWLGTARWLLAAALAHVGATLVSEQAVRLAIRYHQLPRAMAHTVDIGVSYALAGVAAVLTYRLPRRWRWGYAGVLTAFFAWSLAANRTFTSLGHLTALLLGFACYGLTPAARGGTRREPSQDR